MNDFLPSRSVVAFVLIPLLTAFSIWAVISYRQQEAKLPVAKQSLGQTLEEERREFNTKDTDGDGLKDWEEFLAGTDASVVDTDGDTLSDYAEARIATRDPLVFEEVTEAVKQEVEEQADEFGTYQNDETLTKTDILARDIYSSYAQLKDANAINSEIQTSIIDSVVSETVSDKREPTFAYTDLVVVANTNALKAAYKISYTKAAKQLSGITENELILLSAYTESEDVSYLVTLNKHAQAYQEFSQELALAGVPQEIADVHLEYINNIMLLAQAVKGMANAVADPLEALVSAKQYNEDDAIINQNIRALSLYFNEQ